MLGQEWLPKTVTQRETVLPLDGSWGGDSPLWDRNMAWTWKPAVMESKAPGAICLVQAGGPVGGSVPTVPAAIRAGKRWTLGCRTRSAAEYERCCEWWASL